MMIIIIITGGICNYNFASDGNYNYNCASDGNYKCKSDRIQNLQKKRPLRDYLMIPFTKYSQKLPPEGDLMTPFTKKTQKLPPEGDLMTPYKTYKYIYK